MGLTLFALQSPSRLAVLPAPPRPPQTTSVSIPCHSQSQLPVQTPEFQFNFSFGLSRASGLPLTAHSLAFPRPPFVTFQIRPNSPQFARFLQSSTNSPCPFVPHDQRTIPALTFPIPSLTQPDFSYFFTHPPLSFERPPSAISGKDIRPPKHEQGRAQSHSTPASGVNAPLSKCGP